MTLIKLEAPIFDIQKFSVHDGPGIRTLIFFKGCLLNCWWCSNPESQSAQPELMIYPEICIGCHRCLEACPHGAISRDNNQLFYDRGLCRHCGGCARVCPAEARKMAGKKLTVDFVIKEIEKDLLFYRNSGGGVTFGGGEPMLHYEFVKAISIECGKRGIHTAMETCGYYPWMNLEKTIKHLNLVLFDLKHMDTDAHKKLCGQSNELILDNLSRLCEMVNDNLIETEIIVRMPIIPGLNDSEDNIRSTAEFTLSLGKAIRHTEILPYHKFGVKKYERLGIQYCLMETEVPSDGHMQTIKKIMEQYGLNVKIGG